MYLRPHEMCLKSGMEKMLPSRACCSGLQGDYICVYCILLELVGKGAFYSCSWRLVLSVSLANVHLC